MGFDKVKIKQVSLMILYTAVLVLLLIHSDVLFAGLKLVLSIFAPFLIGGAIAFILNIPMNGIEKKILKKWNGKIADKVKRPVSMVLAMIFVIAIVTLVIVAVVPQLKTTISTLGAKITPFVQNVVAWLESLTTDYPELATQIRELENMEFDWDAIINSVGSFLKNGVGNMVGSTFTVASSIIGGVTNIFIAFVFAIYILSQKEKLHNQVNRILDAYAPVKVNRGVREVCHRLHVNFSNFICGQCLESVILGVLFVIFMTIFRMPYAIMIGTLIAFTALIPIVGAFIGCGIGAFMILIDNPVQALWFVIMFLIIQQLEGNLIYPRVVGNSVGLPSIWVLMSVSVGGSLFGVGGMLIFIPLMSTLYSLLRDDVNRRNAGRVAASESGNMPAERQERNRRSNRRNKKRQENATVEASATEVVEIREATVQTEGRRANKAAESQPTPQRESKRAESKTKQERTKNTVNTDASMSKGANTDALAQIIAEVSASVEETEAANTSEERAHSNHRRKKYRRPQNTEQRKRESSTN